MNRTEPDPAWQRRFRHRLPFAEWNRRCDALAAPGKAAEHAEHMMHAQLLEQGMAGWMARALASRRRELLALMRRRAAC